MLLRSHQPLGIYIALELFTGTVFSMLCIITYFMVICESALNVTARVFGKLIQLSISLRYLPFSSFSTEQVSLLEKSEQYHVVLNASSPYTLCSIKFEQTENVSLQCRYHVANRNLLVLKSKNHLMICTPFRV